MNSTEEELSGVNGQDEMEENAHLEEEDKQNEMNVETSDSSQPGLGCRGNNSLEQQESQGACVVEEAVNRYGDQVEKQ